MSSDLKEKSAYFITQDENIGLALGSNVQSNPITHLALENQLLNSKNYVLENKVRILENRIATLLKEKADLEAALSEIWDGKCF